MAVGSPSELDRARVDVRATAISRRRYLDGSGRWRSPAITAVQIGLFLLLGLLPAVPGADRVLRVPVALSLGLAVLQSAWVLLSGWSRSRNGPFSRTTMHLNTLDSTSWILGAGALIAASGSAISFYWLNLVVFLMMFAGVSYRHGVHRPALVLTVVLLVVWFAGAGQPVDASLSLAMGGTLVLAQVLSTLTAHRRDRDDAERELRAEEQAAAASQQTRESIGRELHDGVAAELTAVLWQASALESEEGQAMAKALRQTLGMLRGVTQQQTHPARAGAALAQDLDALLVRLGQAAQIEVVFKTDTIASVWLPGPVCHTVLRAVQEGFRNAVTHGGCQCVEVELCVQRSLVLRVRDDGVGFDGQGGMGRGLDNLRARVEEHNGRFAIEAGDGVCLAIEIPLSDDLGGSKG